MTRTSLALAVLALAACGSDKPADPCAGVTGRCVGFPTGTSDAQVQSAFAQAQPGTTFAFGAGTFQLRNTIPVSAADVTIQGAGREATTLDFQGQAQAGAPGIGAASGADRFTLRDLAIRDPAGNGLDAQRLTGVTVQRVRVSWTAQDPRQHGEYGLFPVLSSHVLVEGSFVSGASDTGIYVGQSQDVVVRDNEVTGNVAGIEIENCFRADVHGNHSHGNTAGVLVFDLPNLEQQGGHQVRVFQNLVEANATANFGTPGDVIALVPRGTGIVVMANADVEVFGNTVRQNATAAVGVISFVVTGQPVPASGYYPFPARVHVHDNTFDANGTDPDTSKDLGILLAVVKSGLGAGNLPDVVWDGIVDPALAGGGANPMQLCFPGASVLNLGIDVASQQPNPSVDATPFRCTLPALPAVALP